MSERYYTNIDFRREELRGLFALGLLAIVATIRIQNPQIIWVIDETTHDVTGFFDVTLVLWSFYAFFMVLGLSKDIIGVKASKTFLSLSTQYLYFSYVLLGLLAGGLFYSIYPTRAPWVFLFLFLALMYFIIKRIFLWARKLPRKWKPIKQSFVYNAKQFLRQIKKTAYQFLYSGFIVCFMLVIWGVYEEYVFPAAIIGSIFLISFLIAHDYVNKSKIEKALDY